MWPARLLLSAVLLGAPAAAPKPFDSPRAHRELQLPPDEVGNPGTLTCDVFDGFAVKEIARRDTKGAERLSLLPFGPGAPPRCEAAAARGEVELSDWSGHFAGARSHYAFFDADDGWEAGSTGFAVYDVRTGRRVLADAAVGSAADIRIDERRGELRLRYRRAWRAACSVVQDGDGCWERIRRELGLRGAAPACAAAYSAQRAPADDPTVLTYDVEVAQLSKPVVRPRDGGGRVECWPAM